MALWNSCKDRWLMRFQYLDQLKFSELSQDYNPIHCDKILARRLIYGQPVVHGVNALIMALSKWSEEKKSSFNISNLKCRFIKPIYLDVEVDAKIEEDGFDSKILLYQDGVLTTNIKFTAVPGKNRFVPSKSVDSKTSMNSSELDISQLEKYSNDIDSSIDVFKAEDYYGVEFIAKIGLGQLAELLAYTRIVGMHAPGMNSIFSELVLSEQSKWRNTVSFEVSALDKRFNLLTVSVDGPCFVGKVNSFYRPKTVKSDEFRHQRALIIGGSRGIGEVTAKYLACGGAEVLITYSKGADDAQRVVSEIMTVNTIVDSMQLDVTDMSNSIDAINDFDPTHIYYYATPFIFSGNKGRFSNDLYAKFVDFYVDRFKEVVDCLCQNGQKRLFFYPSTVAIDDIQMDMLEYTLAKMHAESLSFILMELYRKIKIYTPRLPRMATDQTVSLLAVHNEDPLTILPLLRKFQSFDDE